MIKAHCFQKGWIERLRTQAAYRKINPPVAEKMIHAFSLVQDLRMHGLDFVLKGGTSLVLVLEHANRFSIDVDILTQVGRPEIERLLDEVIKHSVFTGWHLDADRSYRSDVPKAHYKMEYPSHYNKSGYILLDILFERSRYPVVHEWPVQSMWFETESLIHVKLPTIESITGDKLTAFAPNTTGIQFGKGKELEIIKQLFDLGCLFDEIQNVEVVAKSYAAFVRQELAYRALNVRSAEVLWDTIDTCRIVSFRESNKAEPDRSRYEELRRGIVNLEHHLVSGHFRIDQAATAAAKIAYLCIRLLIKDYDPLPRYVGQDVQGLNVTHSKWSTLNKLKKIPEQAAFFFWHEGLRLLGLLEPSITSDPHS